MILQDEVLILQQRAPFEVENVHDRFPPTAPLMCSPVRNEHGRNRLIGRIKSALKIIGFSTQFIEIVTGTISPI
jgi:hypothetical protein